MQIRFSNISWDTDGEEVELPAEATLEAPDDFEPEDQGADLLSDTYGWCVNSFEYETIQAT